jgi:co-chaperonin GroES (HSP10)
MALTAPANNLILQIKEKFQQKIGSLYIDNRLEPQESVTITGTVVSVPRAITERRDLLGYSTAGIKPGDHVIFRYTVIASFSAQPKNDSNVFKNRIWHDGQEYWRCSIMEVFAVIRGEDIVMLNGYVMTSLPSQSNLIYRTTVKDYDCTSATVLNIGWRRTHEPAIPVGVGDTIYFHPRLAQHYRIDEKQFLIIRQSHILGVRSLREEIMAQ